MPALKVEFSLNVVDCVSNTDEKFAKQRVSKLIFPVSATY